MEVWIVGRLVPENQPCEGEPGFKEGFPYSWEVAGVFDSEEKAVAGCRNEFYFIIPLQLNELLPHHSQPIDPRSYYPRREERRVTGVKRNSFDEVKFIDYITNHPIPGILYVSREDEIATWSCPCGCGVMRRISLHKSGWAMTTCGDTVSFSPSILHHDGCKSHYFIRENKIVWA